MEMPRELNDEILMVIYMEYKEDLLRVKFHLVHYTARVIIIR